MYTVLIVEDEDNARRLLRKHVEKQGFQVLEAANLQTGNKIIDTEFIDIVLLDINLPDGNGLTLLSRITQELPTTQVVVITGHGDIDTAVEAMHSGARDFVTKPIDLIEGFDDLLKVFWLSQSGGCVGVNRTD